MTDWIPGVAQVKCGFQLLCGDVEGAEQTNLNFCRQCPGVSQVFSTVQYISGDTEGAVETQKECLRTVSNVADGIPVVGHIKGAAHYAAGDEVGGNKAMRSATRTTAVLGAGAAGFAVGGPLGAAAAGVYTGASMDAAYTIATDEPQGLVAGIQNMMENPNPGTLFDIGVGVVGDALTGTAGGNIVKNAQNSIQMKAHVKQLRVQADAALEIAEQGRQPGSTMTSADVMSYANKAADLSKQADIMEAKVNGHGGGGGGGPDKQGQQSQPSTVKIKSGSTSKQTTQASAGSAASSGSQPPNDRRNQRSRSLSPIPIPKSFNPETDTKSASEKEAFIKAKVKNGIDANQEYIGTPLYVIDRQNKGEYCIVYKFINKKGEIIYIRRDNAVRYNDKNKEGNQPPHFNVSKSKTKSDGNDWKTEKQTRDDYNQSEDQEQHHFFPEEKPQPKTSKD